MTTKGVIFSSARSGSTWLQTALSSHSEVFCTELRSFGNLADTVTDFNDDGSVQGVRMRVSGLSYARIIALHVNLKQLNFSMERFSDDFSTSLAHFMFDYFAKTTGKNIILDKFTVDSIDDITIERYTRRFNDFRFIFLVRDGRDVAVSLALDWIKRRRNGEKLDITDPRYRRFVLKEDVKIDRFFTPDEVKDYAQGWATNVRKLGSVCGHTIRYEDMKTDNFAALHGLLTYLGADASDETVSHCIEESSFEKMSGGRKPGDVFSVSKARSGISGSWRHYFTREDAAIFAEVAHGELAQCGYEIDNDWILSCPHSLSELGKRVS